METEGVLHFRDGRNIHHEVDWNVCQAEVSGWLKRDRQEPGGVWWGAGVGGWIVCVGGGGGVAEREQAILSGEKNV